MLLFIYSFILNKLLGSFVEFCWINHLLICYIDIIWTNNVFTTPFIPPCTLGVFLSKLYLPWILKARCMHILFMFFCVSWLLSLIQYTFYTPSNPKWLRYAWSSYFFSNYAHIYMEFIICIVVSLTTLDPISLGTKMYLNVVLGTLEMQWMLVSFIRKVLSPYDYWRQAMMIGELLSTTSHHCYLGNKYNFHAYFSSIPTLVGWVLAW
jgi:hypothetical protein